MAVAASGSGIACREEAGVGGTADLRGERFLDLSPTAGKRAGSEGRKKPASWRVGTASVGVEKKGRERRRRSEDGDKTTDQEGRVALLIVPPSFHSAREYK